MIKQLDLESITKKTGHSIREIGKTIFKMDKELKSELITLNMRENIKMV